MKQIWLHSVRAYIRLGLFFYFKKIKVQHSQSISKEKAVLFLGNHQNALLDALLIATKNGRFAYFLTRASVFKNALIGSVLKSLWMLPVYRVRDGWSSIANNNSIFKKCSELLHQKQAIVIFPEGDHNLKRTVRPLSKGFTRIVFDTIDRFPEVEMQLIPVGLNYVNAAQFGDSVLLNFGTPISSNNYKSDDRVQNVNQLKKKVFDSLTTLTTHIPSDMYEKTLQKLDALQVDYLQPKTVNACINQQFKACKLSKAKNTSLFKRLCKTLLIIHLILPYLLWKKLLEPKVKEVEFKSTFRFVVAITMVPIFMILMMLALGYTIGIQSAFMYLLNVLLLDILAVKL